MAIPDASISESTKASWAKAVKTAVEDTTLGHSHDDVDSVLIDYGTIARRPINLVYVSRDMAQSVNTSGSWVQLYSVGLKIVLRWLRADIFQTGGTFKATWTSEGELEEDIITTWTPYTDIYTLTATRGLTQTVDMTGYLWDAGSLRIYSKSAPSGSYACLRRVVGSSG